MLRHGNCWLILTFRLISALVLVSITSIEAQAESIPLPKFFGVYALYGGKLTELKRHPQSDSYNMKRDFGFGDKEVINSLSNITFPYSKKLTFIIFSPQVANLNATKFLVVIMATIRNAPPPSFLVTNSGWEFSVAPVPNQPQMVQLIRERGTMGGAFGAPVQ